MVKSREKERTSQGYDGGTGVPVALEMCGHQW